MVQKELGRSLNDLTMVILEPFIMGDQKIQGSSPGSSEFVGERIKLLQSGLIPFPKEKIDISLT